MLKFQPLEITDIPRIRPYLRKSKSRLCDCSCALVMWRGFFNTVYCLGNDSLFISQNYDGIGKTLMPPIGGDFFEGMETLLAYCRTNGQPALFSVVSEDALKLMRTRYTLKRAEPMQDWFDYLYESRALIELSGRRYHGQRNHIARFDREYPNHRYEPLTDTAQAKEFLNRFYSNAPEQDAFGQIERGSAYEALEHYGEYGLTGGVLLVDDIVVSIAVGEILGDTLFVHIEKADKQYNGVYQKTVNMFARTYGADVKYINREEDMGNPGLRASKLSYHPVALLEKYMVELEL